jgi:hypothetical protein
MMNISLFVSCIRVQFCLICFGIIQDPDLQGSEAFCRSGSGTGIEQNS